MASLVEGGGGRGGEGHGRSGGGGREVGGCGYGGGVSRMLLRVLLLSSCLQSLLIIPASGQRSVQCVQIGQWEEAGPYSIGGRRFRVKDRSPMRFTYADRTEGEFVGQKTGRNPPWRLKPACPGYTAVHELVTDLDFCPDDASKGIALRTYLVKEGDRVLRGWLHFEVEIKDPDDEMEYIYVQVRDEAFNAIGEFVSDPKDQCNASKTELISPSLYQFLPCSSTGLREAKTSQGIFVAKPQQYVKLPDSRFLTKKVLERGIHFTWRLNEYWCNRHLRLRLDAFVWSKKSHEAFRQYNDFGREAEKRGRPDERCKDKRACLLKRRISKYWIYPKWFGAADIKTMGQLNCTSPAIINDNNHTSNGTLNPEGSSWLKHISEVLVQEDYIYPGQLYGIEGKGVFYKSCLFDPYIQRVGPIYPDNNTWDLSVVPTFGGRCEKHTKLSAAHNNLPECTEDTKSPEFAGLGSEKWDTYTNYTNHLNKNRKGQCKPNCSMPNISNPEDLKTIKGFPRGNPDPKEIVAARKPSISFETLTRSRVAIRATTFWQTRKYHGNLCIFFTMFLIPVSNLFIRYYKETFMRHRALGCAPWFWFHMFVCFAVPTFYRSGYAAMEQNIQNFGSSEDDQAIFHRVAGRVFIWGFFLMICLGAMRMVSIRARLVCMALHSVIGFALYLLAIGLIINSSFIPSSPSLNECNEEGLPEGFSFTAWLAVAWLVIDVGFHAFLTILQFAIDRRYGIERAGCGLPIVPILPADAREDLVGSRFRKVLLIIYLFLSLTITFTVMGQLFAKEDPGNCNLGPMTCDLTQTMPNRSSSPFGCAAFSLKYYARVYAKYEVNFTRIA